MNRFSDSVHRQAAVCGCSNTQQPASSNVMHDGRSFGKLQKSDYSDVEKSLLNGKRDREFGSVRPKNKNNSCMRDKNIHDYLEREALSQSGPKVTLE